MNNSKLFLGTLLVAVLATIPPIFSVVPDYNPATKFNRAISGTASFAGTLGLEYFVTTNRKATMLPTAICSLAGTLLGSVLIGKMSQHKDGTLRFGLWWALYFANSVISQNYSLWWHLWNNKFGVGKKSPRTLTSDEKMAVIFKTLLPMACWEVSAAIAKEFAAESSAPAVPPAPPVPQFAPAGDNRRKDHGLGGSRNLPAQPLKQDVVAVGVGVEPVVGVELLGRESGQEANKPVNTGFSNEDLRAEYLKMSRAELEAAQALVLAKLKAFNA